MTQNQDFELSEFNRSFAGGEAEQPQSQSGYGEKNFDGGEPEPNRSANGVQSESGRSPIGLREDKSSYTALEIAKLLGVSDSTIRKMWREQLENIYGVGSLQDAEGNYTAKAFSEFQKLQQAISSKVPARDSNGNIAYEDGKPVLVCNCQRIGWAKYKQQLLAELASKQNPQKEVFNGNGSLVRIADEVEIEVVEDTDDALNLLDMVKEQHEEMLKSFYVQGYALGQQARAIHNQGFAAGFTQTTDAVVEGAKMMQRKKQKKQQD